MKALKPEKEQMIIELLRKFDEEVFAGLFQDPRVFVPDDVQTLIDRPPPREVIHALCAELSFNERVYASVLPVMPGKKNPPVSVVGSARHLVLFVKPPQEEVFMFGYGEEGKVTDDFPTLVQPERWGYDFGGGLFDLDMYGEGKQRFPILRQGKTYADVAAYGYKLRMYIKQLLTHVQTQ